jgi:outer membrane lipoprotein-sorting protein
MKNNLKLVLPAALLVLGSALSGCTAGQQVTAADVIQKMRETMKTTQTAQSTVDINATINKQGIETLLAGFMQGSPAQPAPVGGKGDIVSRLPDTASAQIKTWKQAADGTTPAKARVDVVSSSLPGVGGLTFVFDGQKAYALDPNRKVLYTGTPEELLDKLPAEARAALQGADIEQEIDKVLNAADIKLAGTETVAGLEAYKLDITPKPNAAETLDVPKAMQMQVGTLIKDGRATLWVDKDRWIPLKLDAQHPNIGTLTVTAASVDLNQPIDPATFQLQAGSDVTVVDLDKMAESMTPQTLTLKEANEAASQEGWKLLEATYPADATVVGVTGRGNGLMQQGTGHSLVTISYSSPSVDFTVSQAKVEMEPQLGDQFSGLNNRDNALGAMQTVKVRGVDAVAFSPEGGNWTSLVWQESNNGPYIAVRGNLTVDEAVKIAEGLK